MKTTNRQRRAVRARGGLPTRTPRRSLRDAMPIPGVGALALGVSALALVSAVAEVVQRLTGWSV